MPDVISIRQLAEDLAAIKARTSDIDAKLDRLIENLTNLSRATSRLPNGLTLVGAVATILTEVQKD